MTRNYFHCLAIMALFLFAEANWLENTQWADVKWQCNALNGTSLFRYEHPASHHNHQSGKKFLPPAMIQDLVTCGHGSDHVGAFVEAVIVVWSRLGHMQRSYDCHKLQSSTHGGQQGGQSGGQQQHNTPASYWASLEDYGRNLASKFVSTQMDSMHLVPDNVSLLFEQQSRFARFSRTLLQTALSYEPCCRGTNRPCQNWVASGHVVSRSHVPGHHLFDMRNITLVYDQLLRYYDTDAKLPVMQSTLKYMNLAHGNRLLCFSPDDFNITTDKAGDARALLLRLVQHILLGYNLKAKGEYCPITFIKNIFQHHTSANNMHLSDRQFSILMQSLNLTNAKQGRRFSTTHSPPTTEVWLTTPQENREPVQQTRELQDGSLLNAENTVETSRNERSVPHGSVPYWRRILSDLRYMPGDRMEYMDASVLYHLHSTGKSDEPQINECLSSKDILRIFHKEHTHSINLNTFIDLCPVLLHQVLNDACREPVADVTTVAPPLNITKAPLVTEQAGSTDEKVYLYGSLAILVISGCSLLGAVFMRLGQSEARHYVMGSMVALAVGCLVADAVLHLLPEISALHHAEKPEGVLLPDNLQKLCALLASIYAFFMLELYLSRNSGGHGHSHGPETPADTTIVLQNNKLNETNIEEKINLQQFGKLDNAKQNNTNNTDGAAGTSVDLTEVPYTVARTSSSSSSDTASGKAESITAGKSTHLKGKSAIAWMIIIGDGIHNFADGLAVGAAFSLNFTKGLSTSITVLCHEVPHELGDFAVLVSTGMSVRRAMLLNFLSSLTAFAGLYIGLGLGNQPEACMWIFSVGAGMFLYVALTDLIPECKEYFKLTPNWKMAVGQNVGILVGYLAMLLLAMFEDKMEL